VRSKVATEPASVLAVLAEEALGIERIGPWGGSLIAVAVQRVGRSRFAGDLCLRPGIWRIGTDQQERPQWRARHCTDDACWPVPRWVKKIEAV